MKNNKNIQNAEPSAAVADKLVPKIAPIPKVFRVNSMEWYVAHSLEEAIDCAREIHEDNVEEEYFAELTKADMDRYQFCFDENKPKTGHHSFSTEFTQYLLDERPIPGIFATTEW
jgi:hypothetical protein